MNLKKGDIIEYSNARFEVENNLGNSGTVWEINYKHERTGILIKAFYWSAYGEKCKFVKSS